MSRLDVFIAASMTTRYTVDLPDGSLLTLTLGVPDGALDRLLCSYQAINFAYLTAHNPQSSTLSADENEQRHLKLCHELDQQGFHYLTGKAIHDAGEWIPEHCVFAFNMSRSSALKLCQAYDQDGAVVGELGSAPKLMFTHPKLREDFKTLLQSCVLE